MLDLITPPPKEPVHSDDVISDRHLDSLTAESELMRIELLIGAVREHVENKTNRALITQTWRMTLDGFASKIILPRQKVQSIISVKYIDSSGVEQTLDSSKYRLTGWDKRELIPAYSETWPAPRGDADCVTIEWVAGYGDDAKDVPKALRNYMLYRIGTLFEHREDIITGTMVNETPHIENSLRPYIVSTYL